MPGVGAIDFAHGVEDVLDLGREVVDDVDEAAARVGEAVGENRVEVARGVGGERVAHLDRRRERGRAVGQDVGEILPRVLAAVKNRAMWWPSRVATIPEVNTPVRPRSLVGGGRAPLLGGEREHRIVVSSL